MRATLGAGFTDVRVLMSHPMETGQRKDASDPPRPDAEAQDQAANRQRDRVLHHTPRHRVRRKQSWRALGPIKTDPLHAWRCGKELCKR